MGIPTIFFGTPLPAVGYAELTRKLTVLKAVVTQPDREAGRGCNIRIPAVKEWVLKPSPAENNVPDILQPERSEIRDNAFAMKLSSYSPALGIVVNYGNILPQTVLSVFSTGVINIHFSLLPKYRGAAPIQWSIIRGEKVTGVTAFWLDPGMDTGDIFAQIEVRIDEDDTSETLRTKLVDTGLKLLGQCITDIEHGKIIRKKQGGTPSSAPVLKKNDGHIDWSKPAGEVHNLLRGTIPWPGVFTQYQKPGVCEEYEVLKITGGRVAVTEDIVSLGIKKNIPYGTIAGYVKNTGFIVACGNDTMYVITVVQPAGKKVMPAWNFLQGSRITQGTVLK
ncbi:MAG: methionyl-tRNA formyltransferase [Elusimicrobiota bacterium]